MIKEIKRMLSIASICATVCVGSQFAFTQNAYAADIYAYSTGSSNYWVMSDTIRPYRNGYYVRVKLEQNGKVQGTQIHRFKVDNNTWYTRAVYVVSFGGAEYDETGTALADAIWQAMTPYI